MVLFHKCGGTQVQQRGVKGMCGCLHCIRPLRFTPAIVLIRRCNWWAGTKDPRASYL